jgi:hypothetical protein
MSHHVSVIFYPNFLMAIMFVIVFMDHTCSLLPMDTVRKQRSKSGLS